MRRLLSAIIVFILIFAIPVASVEAAGNAELGEMLLTADKVQGNAGDIIKVNFYLYPNLPDGRRLDSISGSMKYDPEFVTLGAINLEDKEENLVTFMKIGNKTVYDFQHNIVEPGEMRFAFLSVYGAEAEGFWFQAEFRIEKEGATDFVFNGISYSGVGENYNSMSFYLEPQSVGGIYTEGQEIPSDGAAGETFKPLEPDVDTPAPVTPTPKPSNNGQPVPITTKLPAVSAKPSNDNTGIVTPGPAVTSMPITTPSNQIGKTTPAGTTPEGKIVSTAPTSDATPDASPESGSDPVAEIPETTDSPLTVIGEESGEAGTQTTPPDPEKNTVDEAPAQRTNMLIVIGVIVGIVAVIGLGAIAIILVLKRRRMED